VKKENLGVGGLAANLKEEGNSRLASRMLAPVRA
jgi:hypothetical protein